MGQVYYFNEVAEVEDLNQLSPTGDNLFCCPYCPPEKHDGKRKLSINLEKNAFHCWRCNAKGTAFRVLKDFSKIPNQQLTNLAFGSFTWNSTKSPIDIQAQILATKNNNLTSFFAYDTIGLKIYDNFLVNAQKYLEKRGLTKEDIEYYDIRVGHPYSYYKDRILIPTYDDYGNVIYVIARDYVHSNTPLKYYNTPGSNKSIQVWNLNNVKKNDIIIITEGCFSGISANRIEGMTAVCTFGKMMSVRQAELIAQKHPKEIIMSLDPDVSIKETITNIKLLRRYYDGLITWAHLPVGKDPNDCTKEEYQKVIMNRTTYNG